MKTKLWKYSGTYLTATGIIHTIVGLLSMGRNGYWPMLKEGFVNSVGENMERSLALWFLVCGVFIIFLGIVLQHYIKATGRPAPMFLGIWLLVFSVIGCAIVPATGFWLFIPQAIIIIMANRKLSHKTIVNS